MPQKLKPTDWDRLKYKHLGHVGIVIANGPGLVHIPLKLLQKYPSFGVNKIFLAENFVSTYYTVHDPLCISQDYQRIIDYSASVKFSPRKYYNAKSWGFSPRDFPIIGPKYDAAEGINGAHEFSVNPNKGLGGGHTVTFVCLQIAYWMGFKTVLLVGLDHRFDIRKNGNDNHFSKNYYKQNEKWGPPDIGLWDKSYGIANLVYRAKNRQIINISVDSACTKFPVDKFENWL